MYKDEKMIFAYAKINMSGSHYAATTARSITLQKVQQCACNIFRLFHVLCLGGKAGSFLQLCF
jgi:hypothetical protein